MSTIENRVPPLVWMVLAAVLNWVIDSQVGDSPDIGGALQIVIAAAFGLIGFGFLGAGISAFSEADTTVNPHAIDDASSLVAVGVYRVTRNPMYVGMACALIGFGVLFGDWVALAVSLPTFVVVMSRLQIVPEERVMAAKFGDSYVTYRSEVRRWI